MTDIQILLTALVVYAIAIVIAIRYNQKWILLATSVLWFVPMLLVENTFISVFSIIMIIATFVIVFYNKEEGDF